MDDQTLAIRIQAEDEFSPVFEELLDRLSLSRDASDRLSGSMADLASKTHDASAGLRDAADASDPSISAAAQERTRVMREAQTFLEQRLLPSVARSGLAGYKQGPGIDALAQDAGVNFQGVADNLTQLTGGATAGLTGGALAGGVGAGLALLMQNPVMQQHLARLNELLQQLITPLAEAIGPALDALAPLLRELKPAFVLIGEALRLYLNPLVQELRLAFAAEQAVVEALRPVSTALTDLKTAIESLGSANPFGGGGGGGHLTIGGVQIFDAGGVVGPDSGPAPAGWPGHRLVLAQLGERMLPPGAAAPSGPAGAASAFHFHVQASDPRAAAQEIRQVIEELIVTRRLGVA